MVRDQGERATGRVDSIGGWPLGCVGVREEVRTLRRWLVEGQLRDLS